MTIKEETITPQKVLVLAQSLPPAEQRWLVAQLNELWDNDLPESATLDEAIELYLADKCSLGRAAELAGVTRWDLQDILAERGIPVMIHGSRSAEEIDALAKELEREGIL